MGDSYQLRVGASQTNAIDEYLEYSRIVGDDDGGTPFTPAQYEAYKKRVTPMRINNRLYVCWSNSTLMDCKLIGPETMCFCRHRYKQHKTDLAQIPETRPIRVPCGVRGCKCSSYHYVPATGSQVVRCHCKHASDEHDVKRPYKCSKANCKCTGFQSSVTCSCIEPYSLHKMIIETKAERLERGHPVGRDVLYKAMGGLTGFSSLAEGQNRFDPSGVGAPSKEFLDQPITSSDNPFLKANVRSIQADKIKQRAIQGQPPAAVAADDDADMAEMMSQIKKPGESDMDYFERRYQERQKAEKQKARATRATAKPQIQGVRMQKSLTSRKLASKTSASK